MRFLTILIFAIALISGCGGGDTTPAPQDTSVTAPDLPTNDTCTPDCTGKACGFDGCGGSCGTCVGGAICDDTGQCKETCIPDCAGKTCGDDGCGGSCGSCVGIETCGPDGTCGSPCAPDCTGKACGDDGCGGSCGLCAEGETCDAAGQCQGEGPNNCGDITYEGCCEGSYFKYCEAGEIKGGECGDQGCGWNAEQGYYECGQEGADPTGTYPIECAGECTPMCDDKQCGADGCGGTCGTCEANEECTGTGLCVSTEIDPGNCCEAQEGPGCSSEEVQACICDFDDFCCATQWDATCAGYVEPAGCAICPAECVPQCEGKLCGDDGCGGTCGDCGFGFWCDADGQCNECIPQCDGKSCGPDTCGGTCGECGESQECTDEGQCVDTCIPQCEGKTCGSDGCGNVCGECAEGETCTDGNCAVAPTCPDECGVFVTGADCQCDSFCFLLGDCCETVCDTCADDFVEECCEPSCDGAQCGDDGCGGTCGECEEGLICGEEQQCIEPPPCVPNCEGKACGDDGCGESCGSCGDTETCDEAGQCIETAPALSGTWVRTHTFQSPQEGFENCQQVLNMSDIGAADPLCDACNYAWQVLLVPVSNTCGDWVPEPEEETFSLGIDIANEQVYLDFGDGWGAFAGEGSIENNVYTGEFYTGFQYYADMNDNGEYDEGEELSLGFQFAISW